MSYVHLCYFKVLLKFVFHNNLMHRLENRFHIGTSPLSVNLFFRGAPLLYNCQIIDLFWFTWINDIIMELAKIEGHHYYSFVRSLVYNVDGVIQTIAFYSKINHNLKNIKDDNLNTNISMNPTWIFEVTFTAYVWFERSLNN